MLLYVGVGGFIDAASNKSPLKGTTTDLERSCTEVENELSSESATRLPSSKARE